MRLVFFLGCFAAATSSCGLLLDFDPGQGGGRSASSSSGGAGGTGGAGGAGGQRVHGWATAFVASPAGGEVHIQDVAVSGDGTWVAGYFAGNALFSRSPAGDDTQLLPGDGNIATFVLRLDATGNVTKAIPIATTLLSELDTGDWLGTRVAPDASGDVFIVSSSRQGAVLLGGAPEPDVLGAFNLIIARLHPDGSPVWASRCSGRVEDPSGAIGTDLSARFAAIVLSPSGTLVVGSTLAPLGAITCTGIASPSATPCALAAPFEAQSGALWQLDPETGACAPNAIRVEDLGVVPLASALPLWLDGVALAGDGGLELSGRVAGGPVTVSPWGAAVSSNEAFAFAGPLSLDGTASATTLRTFTTQFNRFVPGPSDTFVGSVTNSQGASDLRLLRASSVPIAFGNDADAKHEEIATSLSVDADATLVTGWLSQGASLANDLCGAACQGDLVETGAKCDAGNGTRDGYWLLLGNGAGPGIASFGRSISGCGNQTVVDGELSAGALILGLELEGSATIDLLDGTERHVAVGGPGVASVVMRLPRPAL